MQYTNLILRPSESIKNHSLPESLCGSIWPQAEKLRIEIFYIKNALHKAFSFVMRKPAGQSGS
ncbi:hypothetical protein PL75_10465 [Neisseria arctica]|uniref:Uncharacterized protein n=1 Tax=Neisseria arctica TaxID=1470200 RepID=A0A0J0YPD2_9NEIS|nr:hypothetical protein PL75_10465 [Neisseria arctica]